MAYLSLKILKKKKNYEIKKEKGEEIERPHLPHGHRAPSFLDEDVVDDIIHARLWLLALEEGVDGEEERQPFFLQALAHELLCLQQHGAGRPILQQLAPASPCLHHLWQPHTARLEPFD